MKSSCLEKVYSLIDLKIILVDDFSNQYQTKLTFKDNYSLNLVFTNYQVRDNFLSTMLTLRQICFTGVNNPYGIVYANQDSGIKFDERIHGIEILYNNSPHQAIEYELYLIKRLHEVREQDKKIAIMEDIVLNTAFTQVLKVEVQYIKNIFSELKLILMSDTKSELLEKWLNLFSILLNSKVFFLEILEAPEICTQLSTLLLSSKNNLVLTLLSSQCLLNCIEHHTGAEGKAEIIIKRQLISGKQSHDTNPQRRATVPSTTNLFFDKLSAFLLRYEAQFDPLEENQEMTKPDTIIVYAVGILLRSILQTRKSSTGKEEVKAYLDMFLTQDERLFEAL